MLQVFHSMKELSFSQLMDVYEESNSLNGSEIYHNLSQFEQLHEAEQDFFNYLTSVFFRQEDSFYAVWDAGKKYTSALRIEPYLDGVLLCGLETAPGERRKGYAYALLTSLIEYLQEQGSGIIYSHVSKKNVSSLNVHFKTGFQIIKEYAVYSDGSVVNNCYTLALKYEKTET